MVGLMAEVRIYREGRCGDLVFRAITASDATAYAEAMEASRPELEAWIPWVAPQTPSEVETICERYCREFEDNLNYRFGIWEGERFLGMTCFLLRGTPLDWKIGEVGMWIRTDVAGRGHATTVLRFMIEWGFRDWGWERLVWKCDTRNKGSVRVAEKCGMHLEGTLRQDCVSPTGERSDSHIFALLRSDVM